MKWCMKQWTIINNTSTNSFLPFEYTRWLPKMHFCLDIYHLMIMEHSDTNKPSESMRIVRVCRWINDNIKSGCYAFPMFYFQIIHPPRALFTDVHLRSKLYCIWKLKSNSNTNWSHALESLLSTEGSTRSIQYTPLPHTMPLQWLHNGHDSVSNHQPHDCFLNRLFRHKSKKTSKLRVTGLCVGNSPEAGEFHAQMASNAENVSIWWRHHVPQTTLLYKGAKTYRANSNIHRQTRQIDGQMACESLQNCSLYSDSCLLGMASHPTKTLNIIHNMVWLHPCTCLQLMLGLKPNHNPVCLWSPQCMGNHS